MNEQQPVTYDDSPGLQQLPVLPPKETAQVFSRIGLAMALFLLVQQVVVGVLSMVVMNSAPQLFQTGWFVWVLSYVPLYFVAFPVFLAVISKIPQHDLAPAQPKPVTVWGMAQVYLVSVACFLTFNMLTMLISYLIQQSGGNGITSPAEMMMASNPWVNLFFLCLVAPVMEEIIFRQLMYKRLIAFGGKAFILFSSLMFAMLHPNLYQLIYAFLIGLMLAGVRYFTGKLWPCILLHVLINFSGGGGSLLAAHYFGDTVLNIWSTVLMVFAVAGVIVAARWLLKKRKEFVPDPGLYAAPKVSAAIINPGVIFYMILVLLLIVSGFFS